MRLFNWARKQRVPPDELARSLYDMFVQERSRRDELLDKGWIPSTTRSRYLEHTHIYRKAAILLALISEAEQRPNFEPVLQSYEAIIFGPAPTPAGIEAVGAVKSAMKDMGRLLACATNDGTKKVTSLELYDSSSGTFASKGNLTPFVWAMEWFREIGHEENNPVTLMAFARSWMDEYATVVESLRKFRPS